MTAGAPGQPARNWDCEFCPLTFDRLSAAEEHVRSKHPAAEQPDDPFGGHEFHYEPHTDLFRCVRCHMYEVVARAGDGTIKPCTGEPPAGSGPIEVNAW